MILDYEFLIDGQPVLAPDAGVQISESDLDSEDSGRDESGYMHRIVAREKVKTWGLQYSFLTEEEYRYQMSLFAGKPTFTVTYRDLDDNEASTTAYCSTASITLQNRRTKQYKNLKFNIIEC